MGTTVNGNEAMEKPHTLEDYAIDHFRPPPKVCFILIYCEIELHILKRYKKKIGNLGGHFWTFSQFVYKTSKNHWVKLAVLYKSRQFHSLNGQVRNPKWN